MDFRNNNKRHNKYSNNNNNRFYANNQYNKQYVNNQRNKQNINNNQNILNSSWKVYIHNLTEKDWTLDSYKFVFEIKSIGDFWTFFNNVKDFRKFNFYIMRGNIKPVYEDPENKNGYSYSYIIPGRKVTDTFTDILVKMVSENLLNDKNFNEVCGISLTPKLKGISILKVWLKNKNNVLKLNTYNENLMNGRFQLHKFY